MGKKNKYYQPQKDKQYVAGQNIFHYDDDEYNEDGTLKADIMDDFSGSFYDDDGYYQGYGQSSLFNYDYESSSKTNGAASSWWRSKFRSHDTYDYSPNAGGTQDKDFLLRAKLNKELKEIARTVNAVRNAKGALNRERNLKVAWSGSSRSPYRGNSEGFNNISNSSTIHLSPDPLTENSKIKPDWTEDQRRDALIGEALTLTSMKKTLQPVNVKKIMDYEVDGEVIKDLPLMERSEQEKAKLRIIARELWKSLETYKAHAEMLQEYRGCRAYFSAYLAFYSDKGYKEKVNEMMKSFDNSDDVTDALGPSHLPGKYKKSMVAANALAWNVNHANVANDQIEPITEEIEDAMIEAFDVLMEGANMRSTFQRWEASVAAAEILHQLDEDDDEELDQKNGNKIADTLGEGSDAKNGNSDNLFGKSVDNDADVNGLIEVSDLDPDGSDEDISKGFTDLSKGTEYLELNKKSSLDEKLKNYGHISDMVTFEDNHQKEWETASEKVEQDRISLRRSLRYLQQLVEPYAELHCLPEYGLRSGRLSGNALWKVPTQVIDNDRVFHRKHIQGDTQEVSIALVMDYSGSMHGASIEMQRKMALLLYDLFKDFPIVDFHMFAHEAWYVNKVFNMTEIESCYYKGPGGGTNEGSALARSAQEFLSLSPKQNRKVILTLGDGCSEPEAIRKSVKLIRKSGMEVYDILIDGNKQQALDCYGAGKVVTVASHYHNRELSSVDFELLNITEETPLVELLQAQVVAVVRPWLAQLFSRMHKLGAI